MKFSPGGRPDVVGTLTRYNRKTVTVIADSGEHWTVPPGLISKVESAVTEIDNARMGRRGQTR